MTICEVLKLLEILAWPAVAVFALFLIRPHVTALLSGAKVKLSFGGQVIETTLPELEKVLEEQTGEPLSAEHVVYMESLLTSGSKEYANGVSSKDERIFLRPLRNNGLVFTVPRNKSLSKAEAIELSALGRLYLRAKKSATKSDA